MHEKVSRLAKVIKSGKDVALYAASSQASQIIHALRTRYSVSPSCIIDGDVFKQGKQLQSLQIISLERAIHTWPNLNFFCASPLNNSAIIGYLLENNVPKDRIINYEPVEKRLSCPELDNNCTLSGKHVRFCCEMDYPLSIKDNGNCEFMAKDTLLLRKKTISDLINGEPNPCNGCPKLKEDYYFVNPKTRIFIAGETGICNFKCKYCSLSHWGHWDIQENDIDCVAFLKSITELEDISDMVVSIATGEVTIHPDRKRILALCNNRSSTILTNASVYNLDIAKLLQQGYCTLNVSLDSGTKKTFAEVKGSDSFEKVVDNLLKYKKAANYPIFALKYIFIPNVNTGIDDLVGFVDICKKVDPVNVIISYDAFAHKTPNEQTLKSMKLLYSLLNNLGIIVQFSFISSEYIQVIRGNETHNTDLLNQ